ncbi:MAG: hypothetical protein ACI4EO_08775 [Blautia sp.]
MIAYAITALFFSSSETSNFSKKTVFQFDLSTDMSATEVGPGDSLDVKPVVYNDATEEMYVFIQVDMPTTADGALYSFDVDDINITITGYAIGTEDVSTYPEYAWNECKTIGNIQ